MTCLPARLALLAGVSTLFAERGNFEVDSAFAKSVVIARTEQGLINAAASISSSARTRWISAL